MKKLLAGLFIVISSVSSVGLSANANRLTTDVVETAVGTGSFTTLVAAVQAAGLVDALKQDGPITVFAPNDSAFAKLPEGTIPALLADIPALTNILTYHVAVGEKSLLSLAREGELTTLQGKKLFFAVRNRSLYVNNIKVIKKISVKNGQILVIDSVLLP